MIFLKQILTPDTSRFANPLLRWTRLVEGALAAGFTERDLMSKVWLRGEAEIRPLGSLRLSVCVSGVV